MEKPHISMVVAIGKNRAIGKDNQLLWRIPDDMKRFRELTNGHPVIMGRKTWDSLPEKFRPLPNRTNIIVTRQTGYALPGATIVHSLVEAIGIAQGSPGSDEIFVIGGAQLYTEALPYTSRLYLTLIEDEKEADVFFPPYEEEFTKVVSDEVREWEGLHYHWMNVERS